MTTETPVDLSRLPPTFRRLIKAMGLPATLTLLQARGGTRFYVGGQRGRRDKQLLVSLVGDAAALAFYAEFAAADRPRLRGGVASEITLPKLDKLALTYRDAMICADADRSLMELALMYRLTSRQIQNIRAKGPRARSEAETRQIDLFSAAGS
jgi:hypothetical protein